MKKYKRRDFIALTAAGIGAAALPACSLEKDNEHLEEADISRKANTKDEIALNREMPRKLVMQLLDQKVNEYMEISNIGRVKTIQLTCEGKKIIERE